MDCPRSSRTPLSLLTLARALRLGAMALCKCSQCIVKTFKDAREQLQQGAHIDSKLLKQHVLDDQLREAGARAQAKAVEKLREAGARAQAQAQADFGNTVVLATLGAPLDHDQPGLPRRPQSKRPPVADDNDEGDGDDVKQKPTVRTRLVSGRSTVHGHT